MTRNSQSPGTLWKIGGVLWGAFKASAIIFGVVAEETILRIYELPPVWLLIAVSGVASGVLAVKVLIRFRAEHLLNGFRDAMFQVQDWGWNFCIAGLGKAFYDLALGLLPFWQNPWVFVVLTLYGAIVANAWWMKKSFLIGAVP